MKNKVICGNCIWGYFKDDAKITSDGRIGDCTYYVTFPYNLSVKFGLLKWYLTIFDLIKNKIMEKNIHSCDCYREREKKC